MVLIRTGTATGVAAMLLALAAPTKAEDVQCTIKLKACGQLEQPLSPLTKIKEGLCPMVVDVASTGTKPKSPYSSATIWIGVAVSGDTIIFGKGEVNAGIALECSWNLEKPKPEQQIASLKASLPQLLNNEQFQKQYPGIKKIDVTKLKTLELADKPCAQALAEFAKRK